MHSEVKYLPELKRIRWKPSWRLVASRFAPISLFDRVTSEEDLAIILEIEGLTNDRIRQDLGQINLIAEKDRIFGPGTTPIMAAFTHLNPQGSRFSDGSYGVYYAGKTIQTAVAETRFHRERFLSATKEPEIEVDMRSYASNIEAKLHDIRNLQSKHLDIYNPDPLHYGFSQAFAKELRNNGSNGIVYSSVRHERGECISIFRPKVLKPVVQGSHYCFCWDGKTIVNTYIKKSFE